MIVALPEEEHLQRHVGGSHRTGLIELVGTRQVDMTTLTGELEIKTDGRVSKYADASEPTRNPPADKPPNDPGADPRHRRGERVVSRPWIGCRGHDADERGSNYDGRQQYKDRSNHGLDGDLDFGQGSQPCFLAALVSHQGDDHGRHAKEDHDNENQLVVHRGQFTTQALRAPPRPSARRKSAEHIATLRSHDRGRLRIAVPERQHHRDDKPDSANGYGNSRQCFSEMRWHSHARESL